MSVAALSCYRFDRAATRLWAFSQMQRAHARFRRARGLQFYKLCGAGRNFASPLWPDWSVYGVVSVWPDKEAAEAATLHDAAAPFQPYRERAAESLTLLMQPLWSRGEWDGRNPFGAEDAARDASSRDVGPLAVLTRATLKRGGMRPFWRRAPDVDASVAADPSVLFKIGLGELPWRNQVTFSVWPDLETMRRFAYHSAAHAQAARAAFSEGWFREDLFARFSLLSAHGVWRGAPADALLRPA